MTSRTLDAPAPAGGAPNRKPAARPSWDEYLTGKKVAAAPFLARMAKGGIPVPTPDTLAGFAEAVRARPERVLRLAALVQAAAGHNESVRGVVLQLAEAGLSGVGLWPVEENAVERAAWSWLRRAKKRPLPAAELGALYLLLQVATQHRMVDEGAVQELLEEALARPAKSRARQTAGAPAAPSAVLPLLAVDPTAAVLAPVLRVHRAMAEDADALRAELRARTAEAEALVAARTELRAAAEQARVNIEALRAEKAAAEARITELQAQLVDVHDGYRHKLREVRGRVRGVLGGELTRWLRTGLAASRAMPPRIPVVEERLEDALTLIEKEMEWLQPSAWTSEPPTA